MGTARPPKPILQVSGGSFLSEFSQSAGRGPEKRGELAALYLPEKVVLLELAWLADHSKGGKRCEGSARDHFRVAAKSFRKDGPVRFS
jgi:hypothetical protein